MEYVELLSKSVALIAVVLGFPKILEQYKKLIHASLQKEFVFIKEFIADLPNAHPYVIEKGFQAIRGNGQLMAKEITHLLSLASPGNALRCYSDGYRYLELKTLTPPGGLSIAFKAKYTVRIRKIYKVMNGVAYFFFAMVAGLPIVFAQNIFNQDWQSGLLVGGVFLFLFSPLAYSFLVDLRRLRSAEAVVNMQ